MSDRSLAIVVRQMALHCNLASIIQKSLQSGREPYASNWLERLRAIKRLRDKVRKRHFHQGSRKFQSGIQTLKSRKTLDKIIIKHYHCSSDGRTGVAPDPKVPSSNPPGSNETILKLKGALSLQCICDNK